MSKKITKSERAEYCPSLIKKRIKMKTKLLGNIALSIAFTLCITNAHAQTKQPLKHLSSDHSIQGNYTYADSDSSNRECIITYYNGGSVYRLKMVDEKVTELYVDDKKIPADSFYLYNTVISKIKEQRKIDRAQAEEDRKQAVRDEQQAEEDRKQSVKDMEQSKRDQEQAEEDRRQAEEDRKQSVKDIEQSKRDQEQAEQDRKQAVKEMEDAKKDQVQAEEDRKQAELDRKQALRDQEQAEIDRKQAEEDRALVKAVITQLVSDNVIPDEKSLVRLRLTEDELVINGKKQPEELHNKYKAKYLKKPGFGIYYGEFMSGYGIFTNDNDLKKKDQ